MNRSKRVGFHPGLIGASLSKVHSTPQSLTQHKKSTGNFQLPTTYTPFGHNWWQMFARCVWNCVCTEKNYYAIAITFQQQKVSNVTLNFLKQTVLRYEYYPILFLLTHNPSLPLTLAEILTTSSSAVHRPHTQTKKKKKQSGALKSWTSVLCAILTQDIWVEIQNFTAVKKVLCIN